MGPVVRNASGGNANSSNVISGGKGSSSAAAVSRARGSGSETAAGEDKGSSGRRQPPSDEALLRVRASPEAVSSQGAAPLNGSNAEGYSPKSSTGCSGPGSSSSAAAVSRARGSSGRRQSPSDEAVCRVRAGLTCLDPTGTVLPNRLNAEGRELISGAGSGVSGWAADFEAGR